MNDLQGQQMLRLPEVLKLVGLSKSTIYLRIGEGDFPAPVRIGAKAVAWRRDELEAWLSSRPRAGRAA